MASFLSAVREGARGAWHTVRGGRIRNGNLHVQFDVRAKELGLGFFGRRRLAAATRVAEKENLTAGQEALARESSALEVSKKLREGEKPGLLRAFAHRVGNWRLRAAARESPVKFTREMNIQAFAKANKAGFLNRFRLRRAALQGDETLKREADTQVAIREHALGAVNRWRLRQMARGWSEPEAHNGFGALKVASTPGFALRAMRKFGTSPYAKLVEKAQLKERQAQAQREADARQPRRQGPRRGEGQFEWPSAHELQDEHSFNQLLDQMGGMRVEDLEGMPDDVREHLEANLEEGTVDEIINEAAERKRKVEDRQASRRPAA